MTASHHEANAITLYALCVRLCVTFFICLSSLLPPFDSSHLTVLPSSGPSTLSDVFVGSLLRWDEFYFADISKDGYKYEHEWAFFPGVSYPRRLLLGTWATGVGRDTSSLTGAIFTGALSNGLTVWSARTLYLLSLEYTRSASAARLSALLSLLPSSPAVIFYAGYTEPLFNLCSYLGKHNLHRRCSSSL